MCICCSRPKVSQVKTDDKLLFLTNSQSFNFTNKDSGVRAWDESLPAQKGRERSWMIFLLHQHPRKKPSPMLVQTILLKLNFPPFYFPSLSLSDLLIHSYSLWFSCQLIACSTSYPMDEVYLILFTIFKQKLSD